MRRAALVATYGTPAVELRFDGAAPEVAPGEVGAVDGSTMRLGVARPGEDLPRILRALGSQASCVTGIEVVGSSLESVYLTLTGRRYEGQTAVPWEQERPDRVVAS